MKSAYIHGWPPRDESIAVEMCVEAGAEAAYYILCCDKPCVRCIDGDLYKACPTCGTALLEGSRPYTCECGTMLWVCFRYTEENAVVTRFIVPDTLDDII